MKTHKARIALLGLIAAVWITPVGRADQAMDSQKMDQMGMDNRQAPATDKPAAEPMKMEKKAKRSTTKGKKAETMATYKCPMDGTMSDKPGKCPKCGMEMEKVTPAAETKRAPMEKKPEMDSMDKPK